MSTAETFKLKESRGRLEAADDFVDDASYYVTFSQLAAISKVVDRFHLSVVKAFNHLQAEQLGANPALNRQRQVVFVSSNDADASATVAAVATQLGFAPVELGSLDQGGAPLHVLGGRLAVSCFRI